jgi:DNA repair protein RecO (recombination protein O)
VLRTRVYGESDKIVTFLTRDYGKLSAIAKGALRSRRRFVNALEPFTHVRLGFRIRPHGDLGWVESAEIVRPARNVTRDLDRYAWSTYVLEVIDCMVEGREADSCLFDLAERSLREIDSSFPAPLSQEMLRSFEARLLDITGFTPSLETCSRCAASTTAPGRHPRFNPLLGTVLCERCSDGSGMELSSEALAAAVRLRDESPPAPLAGPLATEVRLLLQTAIAHHVRRPLRSPALLREILGL